jgi:hypothetical protein
MWLAMNSALTNFDSMRSPDRTAAAAGDGPAVRHYPRRAPGRAGVGPVRVEVSNPPRCDSK